MANAVFYQGLDTLSEKATLTFAAVNPDAMVVNWHNFDVVIGADAQGTVMIEKLFATDEYVTIEDVTSGIDTDNETAIQKMEYI